MLKLLGKSLTRCSNNVRQRTLIATICIDLIVRTCRSISATLLTVRELNLSYNTISNSNVKCPTVLALCQRIDAIRNRRARSLAFGNSRSHTCFQSILRICFRDFRLRSHNNRASLGNNLLLVRLVNVASQSRNQQGGQDGQDDQDDDELDQGEALLVLHFANFLEHDKFLQ